MNMRTSIFSMSFCLVSAAALAGPKEDVTAATAKWGEVLAQQNPDTERSLTKALAEADRQAASR